MGRADTGSAAAVAAEAIATRAVPTAMIRAMTARPRDSTPEEYRFTSTDFNSYVTVSTASGAPQRVQGFMEASREPGLGVRPKWDVLGPHVVDVH